MELLTTVFPTAVPAPRWPILKEEAECRLKGSGWGEAALTLLVTIPCLSWSVSHANERSKRVLHTDRPPHRKLDDGSMRICPSQSTVMKAKVGSTDSLTTARSNLCRSAILAQ